LSEATKEAALAVDKRTLIFLRVKIAVIFA
jgi:hypothetical protein